MHPGKVAVIIQGFKRNFTTDYTHWKEGGLESPIPTVLGMGGCKSEAADITDC